MCNPAKLFDSLPPDKVISGEALDPGLRLDSGIDLVLSSGELSQHRGPTLQTITQQPPTKCWFNVGLASQMMVQH